MDGFVVRLRGLPWSATPDDVATFFEGCETAGGMDGIHLTQTREGRATGEAFVEFVSEDDVQKALEKNKEHIGSRYVEVFRSKKSEMDWVVKRSGAEHVSTSDACVKLRGLPFGCSKEEIAQFFSGLEIVPNGIMLPEDRLGRSTGEAFVQFASQAIAERALSKHKERIGHRYIEIFKSCLSEANAVTGRERGFRAMGRPGPYDRGDRFSGASGGPMGMGFNRGRGGRGMKGFYDDSDSFGGGGFGYGRGGSGRFDMMDSRGGMSKPGHWVRMRGLPFQAVESDIYEFFSPLQPLRVEVEYTDGGRPSGVANVEFSSHQDALQAMKKHRSNMHHRYIELFLNSSQDESFGSSGMGGGYGGNSMGNSMDGNMMGGGSFGSSMGSGGSMGGNYGGQYSGSSGGGYSSNNMGSTGYMGNGSTQSSSYGGNQGYNMGGGGGYSGMGSGTMGSLANSNYTAF